jgi:glycosyltransferase involved in cell wall biosynthesis
VEQLRAVARDPAAAREVGQRAKAQVVDRFTWDAAARGLLAAAARVRETSEAGHSRREQVRDTVHSERSPYWLGLRVSVVIPTYNRKVQLLECLAALDRQSVLPQEFEVVVVDDGSTDGTEAAVRGRDFPFALQVHRQENRGPGAARNLGIAKARGELILFIGDDIIADSRLLETHLDAHATRPDAGNAVLGHIDWLPSIAPTAVMDYVCGVSSLQFAYHHIPGLPSLDYRFFYTSNISLKRRFLVDAAADGIGFDPSFAFAAFEDSELAYRLEPRGLRITYVPGALVYHDHPMDLAGFSKREYNVGQMAVVFYRKHPKIDDMLQVRWIAEWVDAVDRLASQPALLERVKAIDRQTDSFLAAMAQSLEGVMKLDLPLTSAPPHAPQPLERMTSTLHAVLGVIFDVERTRGKVHEWYAGVEAPDTIDAAKTLLGCMRKLDFLTANPSELARLRTSANPLAGEVAVDLRARVTELERELGIGRLRRPGPSDAAAGGAVKSLLRRAVFRRSVASRLRAADFYLQEALKRRGGPQLAQYQRIRNGLRRLLS